MSDNLKEYRKKASRKIRFQDPLLTGKECKEDEFFQVYQLFVERITHQVWSGRFQKKHLLFSFRFMENLLE